MKFLIVLSVACLARAAPGSTLVRTAPHVDIVSAPRHVVSAPHIDVVSAPRRVVSAPHIDVVSAPHVDAVAPALPAVLKSTVRVAPTETIFHNDAPFLARDDILLPAPTPFLSRTRVAHEPALVHAAPVITSVAHDPTFLAPAPLLTKTVVAHEPALFAHSPVITKVHEPAHLAPASFITNVHEPAILAPAPVFTRFHEPAVVAHAPVLTKVHEPAILAPAPVLTKIHEPAILAPAPVFTKVHEPAILAPVVSKHVVAHEPALTSIQHLSQDELGQYHYSYITGETQKSEAKAADGSLQTGYSASWPEGYARIQQSLSVGPASLRVAKIHAEPIVVKKVKTAEY